MVSLLEGLSIEQMQAEESWRIPTGVEGARLACVVLALVQRWVRGDLEGCVRNLPLLAEKLDDCGLSQEARVARYDWVVGHGDRNTAAKLICRSYVAKDLPRRLRNAGRNPLRLLWFAPGQVDVITVGGDIDRVSLGIWDCFSHCSTGPFSWFGPPRPGCYCDEDLLKAFLPEEKCNDPVV